MTVKSLVTRTSGRPVKPPLLVCSIRRSATGECSSSVAGRECHGRRYRLSQFCHRKLNVRLTNGGQSTDRLEIRNQGTAAGQIGVSGNNVTLSGLVIGTFTGGTGTVPLVITFNTRATPSRVQSLLRNITYRSVSENPVTTARSVRVAVSDGDGGTSIARSKQINVVAVNDAQSFTGFGATVNYTAGSAAVLLSSSAVVTDVDSANFGMVS